jgi:uncharacterized membrane protein YqaE (UPF0057 family)
LRKELPVPTPGPAIEGSSLETAPMWAIIILCILLPPLGVYLMFGIDNRFWISLILTLLFILPGIIYSLIVVLQG